MLAAHSASCCPTYHHLPKPKNTLKKYPPGSVHVRHSATVCVYSSAWPPCHVAVCMWYCGRGGTVVPVWLYTSSLYHVHIWCGPSQEGFRYYHPCSSSYPVRGCGSAGGPIPGLRAWWQRKDASPSHGTHRMWVRWNLHVKVEQTHTQWGEYKSPHRVEARFRQTGLI